MTETRVFPSRTNVTLFSFFSRTSSTHCMCDIRSYIRKVSFLYFKYKKYNVETTKHTQTASTNIRNNIFKQCYSWKEITNIDRFLTLKFLKSCCAIVFTNITNAWDVKKYNLFFFFFFQKNKIEVTCNIHLMHRYCSTSNRSQFHSYGEGFSRPTDIMYEGSYTLLSNRLEGAFLRALHYIDVVLAALLI